MQFVFVFRSSLSHRCYGTFKVDISYFIFVVLYISVGYQNNFLLLVVFCVLIFYWIWSGNSKKGHLLPQNELTF